MFCRSFSSNFKLHIWKRRAMLEIFRWSSLWQQFLIFINDWHEQVVSSIFENLMFPLGVVFIGPGVCISCGCQNLWKMNNMLFHYSELKRKIRWQGPGSSFQNEKMLTTSRQFVARIMTSITHGNDLSLFLQCMFIIQSIWKPRAITLPSFHNTRSVIYILRLRCRLGNFWKIEKLQSAKIITISNINYVMCLNYVYNTTAKTIMTDWPN